MEIVGTEKQKVSSLSVVVPFYEEEENILELYENLKQELEKLSLPYEMIFVDDGSKDKSFAIMEGIANKDSTVKVLGFQFNCGQTSAMQAGFDVAQNEIVVPMDGDGQNDPKDIALLIQKSNEGYDLVSGWRKSRQDRLWTRKLPSWVANRLVSLVGRVPLHDYGCSLKAYRRSILKNFRLYGEMHRFIPVYMSWYGARITEIPVSHHARKKGFSKYGLSRIFKVILDIITVQFLGRYSTRPIYFFGTLGFGSFFLAFLGILYLLYKQFFLGGFVDSPFFLISVMLIVMGLQFILIGVLAEVLTRIYHESQKKKTYVVARHINLSKDQLQEL